MNYMKEIARMLGVELGERFKVSGIEETVYLDKDGLKADGKEWGIFNNVLMCLVTGKNEIIKLPWKTKNGERYYYVDTDGIFSYENFDSYIPHDLAMYKLGKIYRTKEEAKAHAEEDKAFWQSIQEEIKQ